MVVSATSHPVSKKRSWQAGKKRGGKYTPDDMISCAVLFQVSGIKLVITQSSC